MVKRVAETIIWHPAEAVMPIMTYSVKEQRRTSVLGTGFFINANGVALTAKHILDRYDEAKEDLMVTLVDRNEDIYDLKTAIIHKSKNYDIAALKVAVSNNKYLTVGGRTIHNNIDYMTVEYSRISFEQDISTGLQTTFLKPSCRKGNIISIYPSEWPETAPTKTMEVSFPVLQGASGAPLFECDDPWHVVGMITHSIEYELTPAQTIRIQADDKHSEETKYFLPVGKAIHFEHLSEFIEELRGLGLYN